MILSKNYNWLANRNETKRNKKEERKQNKQLEKISNLKTKKPSAAAFAQLDRTRFKTMLLFKNKTNLPCENVEKTNHPSRGGGGGQHTTESGTFSSAPPSAPSPTLADRHGSSLCRRQYFDGISGRRQNMKEMVLVLIANLLKLICMDFFSG